MPEAGSGKNADFNDKTRALFLYLYETDTSR
jgi:hypothetical protein